MVSASLSQSTHLHKAHKAVNKAPCSLVLRELHPPLLQGWGTDVPCILPSCPSSRRLLPWLFTTIPIAAVGCLVFAGPWVHWPDHTCIYHFCIYPTSCRIRPWLPGSVKPAMAQLATEGKKTSMWHIKKLVKVHPVQKLANLCWKLNKKTTKKEKRDTTLLPSAPHQVLTSDITSDFHYRKTKKAWPCRTDTLFERKRACYLSQCVQQGHALPRFGNK